MVRVNAALRDLRRFLAFTAACVGLGAVGVFAACWYVLVGVR